MDNELSDLVTGREAYERLLKVSPELAEEYRLDWNFAVGDSWRNHPTNQLIELADQPESASSADPAS